MLYHIFKNFFFVIFIVFNRFQIIGAENVPETGPVIVVGNHTSYWDPMVLGSAVGRRQVHFMAKEAIFKIPLIGFLVKAWGAIPVKRGRNDRDAVTKALAVLNQGGVFGIFIEGTRNKKDPAKLIKPQSGTAMLAVHSGAAVVPITLINTRKILWSFQRVTAIIGKPLQFEADPEMERKELYAQISAAIVRQIEAPLQQKSD